jgi:hypothetical protein
MGATNAVVSFTNSSFEDHLLVGTADGGASGGGAGVYYAEFQPRGAVAAVNVTTTFDGCTFRRNRVMSTQISGGGSFGAGLDLLVYGTAYENTKWVISNSTFVDNVVQGMGDFKTAGASGGAIYISLTDDASVEVHGCTFGHNFAERQGGAMTVTQSNANPAMNLNMSAAYLGANYNPSWQCLYQKRYMNRTDFREWDYGTSTLLLEFW